MEAEHYPADSEQAGFSTEEALREYEARMRQAQLEEEEAVRKMHEQMTAEARKTKIRNRILMLVPLVLILLGSVLKPAMSRPSGWHSENGSTYYLINGEKATGWRTIDGNRYYFSGNGIMRTGWVGIDGELYYFFPDGKLKN